MEKFTILYMSSVLLTVTPTSPQGFSLKTGVRKWGEFYSLSSALGKYYTHKNKQVGTHILIVYCSVLKINGRKAEYYEQIYCKNYTKSTLSKFLNI